MKPFKKFKIPGLLTLTALSVPVIMATLAIQANQSYAGNNPKMPITPIGNSALIKITNQPRIQIAILLDTSSSMSGLIDQSREQIWQVVNEFSEATQHGVKPILEVAVFEYGNSNLHSKNGFIRKVSGLTSELDQVSEALFSLTTGGGEEYCGYVINTAVNDLNWSNSKNDIKSIFIAGNEPFTQGPIPFRKAIAAAKQKGIVVNTIHAGNHQQGMNTGWQEGAVLAGGNFMSIDHNQQVVHINAPQDKRLAELNSQLNQTYLPYGADGRKKAERQAQQDKNSSSVSAGLLAKRARSKASGYYRNSQWDLVDAEKEGKVDLDRIDEKELPASMRTMSKAERKKYVTEVAGKRKIIQQEILALSKQRKDYVTEAKKKQAKENGNTMEEALTTAIRSQAKQKNFDLN